MTTAGGYIKFLPEYFEVIQPPSTSGPKHRSIGMMALLQLPAVSRQLRAETKSLPYSLNAFDIPFSGIEDFVSTVPGFARDAIKVLRMPHTFLPPLDDDFYVAIGRLSMLERVDFEDREELGLGTYLQANLVELEQKILEITGKKVAMRVVKYE